MRQEEDQKKKANTQDEVTLQACEISMCTTGELSGGATLYCDAINADNKLA